MSASQASQATPHTQVSGEDIFAHFMPGQRIQVDFAEKGNGNYLMIVDYVSGFMQAYKTSRKSTEDAIKCLRDWASKWGMPYEVKSDNGSSFRKEWEEELKKLGVKVATVPGKYFLVILIKTNNFYLVNLFVF